MVVYPLGFAAAELAAGRTPLENSRIGWHTYTRNAIYSDVFVGSERPEAPRDAPLRPETYEFWQSQEGLPWTWHLDLGEVRQFDYVGVAGHTLGTSQAYMSVNWSTDAAVWAQFSDFAVPTDNKSIMFLGPPTAARYVALDFFPTVGGIAVPPKVAVIHIGIVLPMVISVQPGHRPTTLSRKTVLRPLLSRTGQFLGQNARSTGVTGSASFVGIRADWYRTYFEPFVVEARNFPFFFAWNPEDYPAEVAYAWANGDIAPSQQVSDIVNVDFDMTGLG